MSHMPYAAMMLTALTTLTCHIDKLVIQERAFVGNPSIEGPGSLSIWFCSRVISCKHQTQLVVLHMHDASAAGSSCALHQLPAIRDQG